MLVSNVRQRKPATILVVVDYCFSGKVPIGAQDVIYVKNALTGVSQNLLVLHIGAEKGERDRGVVSNFALGKWIPIPVENLTSWSGNRKGPREVIVGDIPKDEFRLRTEIT